MVLFSQVMQVSAVIICPWFFKDASMNPLKQRMWAGLDGLKFWVSLGSYKPWVIWQFDHFYDTVVRRHTR